MPLPQINSLLEACAGPEPPFPPTDLFQEKWLIRLVLAWFAHRRNLSHPLQFVEGARWFSEAYMPSAFLARKGFRRKDSLAEKWSRADGVIGHFTIGARGKNDLSLAEAATQLKVLEAKVFSPLSPGVANAPYYDQAARNVACMAEVLKRKPLPPDRIPGLAFYVLAPRAQIFDRKLFENEMQLESMYRKVRRRVDEYVGTHDAWFNQWFQPTLERIDIQCICWEDTIAFIRNVDQKGGEAIDEFYAKCLQFCAPKALDDVSLDCVSRLALNVSPPEG